MRRSLPPVRVLATALVGGAIACSQAVAAAPSYSAIYAFGDSLSDTGNLLSLTTIANQLGLGIPVLPQPFAADSGGYWQGRFSNGPVAVEHLAARLGLSERLLNFAYGGATSGPAPTYPTPFGNFDTGLTGQLGLYNQLLADSNKQADPDALYFMWVGGNDLRDGLGALANPALSLEDKTNLLTTTVLTTAINIGAGLQQLHGLGARNFLVPLLPDFGLTPEGAALQQQLDLAGLPLSLSDISLGVNFALSSVLGQVALPGADLTLWDPIPLQRTVAANPAAFGIGDVLTPCFAGYVGEAGAVCAAGLDTNAMFWDKVHPSAITHGILGNAMAAAVPEPATMLMMAVGIVALVGASRRRQG